MSCFSLSSRSRHSGPTSCAPLCGNSRSSISPLAKSCSPCASEPRAIAPSRRALSCRATPRGAGLHAPPSLRRLLRLEAYFPCLSFAWQLRHKDIPENPFGFCKQAFLLCEATLQPKALHQTTTSREQQQQQKKGRKE